MCVCICVSACISEHLYAQAQMLQIRLSRTGLKVLAQSCGHRCMVSFVHEMALLQVFVSIFFKAEATINSRVVYCVRNEEKKTIYLLLETLTFSGKI